MRSLMMVEEHIGNAFRTLFAVQVRDQMDWRWQDGLRLRTRYDLLMGHDPGYLFLVT